MSVFLSVYPYVHLSLCLSLSTSMPVVALSVVNSRVHDWTKYHQLNKYIGGICLPTRSQCSQWHPIACPRKWRRTSFRLESTHGSVGCSSEWPR